MQRVLQGLLVDRSARAPPGLSGRPCTPVEDHFGEMLSRCHSSVSESGRTHALCYAIVLPGRTSAFRAGFWLDYYREITEIGPPAGLRPAGGPISVFSR